MCVSVCLQSLQSVATIWQIWLWTLSACWPGTSKSTTVLFIWTQTACRVQYVVCSEREYIHPVSSRTQRENIQLKILFHWEDYLHFLYNWNFSPVQSISGKCLLLFSSLNSLFSVSFSVSLVKWRRCFRCLIKQKCQTYPLSFSVLNMFEFLTKQHLITSLLLCCIDNLINW